MVVISRAVTNKCLNVRERVEMVEWNKMAPSLPLLSCELLVSVKENRDRKKKNSSVYPTCSIENNVNKQGYKGFRLIRFFLNEILQMSKFTFFVSRDKFSTIA